MDDLISRQDAIDALSHMYTEDDGGITVSRANVDSMLKALPSAQQEIIYCKDCKFSAEFVGDVWLCRRCKKAFRVLAVDTCKDAKRRANE